MSARILIVDDEAAIRDMVRMALEVEGFDVADASNAHQAGSLLNRGRRFDLILARLDDAWHFRYRLRGSYSTRR